MFQATVESCSSRYSILNETDGAIFIFENKEFHVTMPWNMKKEMKILNYDWI